MGFKMKLKKLDVKNFRNYDKLNLKFQDKINIFYGDNAEGKTNILESIYVLALTKSHKNVKNEELIKFNEDFLKVKGNIEVEDKINTQEIIITKNEKKVKINDIEEKKLSNYISYLNVILFTPDDLNIVKGSPGIRRKLLNIDIGQIHNKYINILNEYNLVLKMRNEYLKNIKNVDNYLDIITEKLIDLGVKIYNYRHEFIDEVNKSVGKIYDDLTKFGELKIIYNNTPMIDDFFKLKDLLIQEYKEVANREINYGKTLFGPQIDDFSFMLGDIDLKIYGSQGQQRSAVLAFKFAEIDIFKEKPILLLDDVLSELDRKKKNNLIKYINKDIQTIITTTNIKNISNKLLKGSKVFKVSDNKVMEIDEVKLHGKK